MRLWPHEIEQAQALAMEDERSAAVFMRAVYLRGLELYLLEQRTVRALREGVARSVQGAAAAALASVNAAVATPGDDGAALPAAV